MTNTGEHPLKAGDVVSHATFGTGTVISASQADPRASKFMQPVSILFQQGNGVPKDIINGLMPLTLIEREDTEKPPGAATTSKPKGKNRIDLTIEPEAILQISDVINLGGIPGLYARSGVVSQVTYVDDGISRRLVIREVGPDGLRLLLARHTVCYRVRKSRERGFIETRGLPAVSTARAVLSESNWSGLPVLAGVTTMPVIRRDGTVLEAPGYDTSTRLYYEPAYPIAVLPAPPTTEDIAQARGFLLDFVLHDFPWDSAASRANYVALLISPLIRTYHGGLAPLGLISAATRGSGKSLLCSILEALYGSKTLPWARTDEEMGKTLTTLLKNTTEPVICFDNIDSFDTVNHPQFAAVLTMEVWTTRLLGGNHSASVINDRVWLCNGNNLSVGGDIASRSVLVRLDPQMERPEERTGFKIEDIWDWLHDDANRAELLRALLILIQAWINGGAKRDPTIKMRNFSSWAQAAAGFLAFHQIDGFLGNRDEIAGAVDEEESATTAFITKWFERYGSAPQRASDLVDSARVDIYAGQLYDPWDGTFPSSYRDGKSAPFSSRGLGKFLMARRDRIFAGHALRGELNKKSHTWAYRVVKLDEEGEP